MSWRKYQTHKNINYLRSRRWSSNSWSFFNSMTLFVLAEISSHELTFSYITRNEPQMQHSNYCQPYSVCRLCAQNKLNVQVEHINHWTRKTKLKLKQTFNLWKHLVILSFAFCCFCTQFWPARSLFLCRSIIHLSDIVNLLEDGKSVDTNLSFPPCSVAKEMSCLDA